jgi:hypothetical protein
MAYDASIILQGQPVNVLGAMSAGNELAAQTQAMQRQNALSALYKSQGAGIMNGDPNALNALAQFDPNAALGIKSQQQSMGFDAEKMSMLREGAKNAAADRAKALTAEQRTAEAAKLEAGLKGAAFFYQKGDRQGYTSFIQQQGLDPEEFTFDSFPAHAAQIDGVLEAYKTFAPEKVDPTKGAPNGYLWNDPTDPRKGVSPIAGMQPEAKDDYQRYVQEESAAGRQPLDRIGFENAKKGKGFSVTTADGTVVEYGGSGADKKAALATEQAKVAADVVTGKIGEAKSLVTNSGGFLPTTGYGGQKLMNTGGTAANDLRATLETIKANVAFDKLQQMRVSSPTGGALGAVSDKEMSLLSSALTSLDQSQSAEQLMQNLQNLEAIYKTITDKLNAPPATAESPAAAQPSAGDVALPPDLLDIYNQYK